MPTHHAILLFTTSGSLALGPYDTAEDADTERLMLIGYRADVLAACTVTFTDLTIGAHPIPVPLPDSMPLDLITELPPLSHIDGHDTTSGPAAIVRLHRGGGADLGHVSLTGPLPTRHNATAWISDAGIADGEARIIPLRCALRDEDPAPHVLHTIINGHDVVYGTFPSHRVAATWFHWIADTIDFGMRHGQLHPLLAPTEFDRRLSADPATVFASDSTVTALTSRQRANTTAQVDLAPFGTENSSGDHVLILFTPESHDWVIGPFPHPSDARHWWELTQRGIQQRIGAGLVLNYAHLSRYRSRDRCEPRRADDSAWRGSIIR